MKKKLIAILSLVLVAVLLLGGCAKHGKVLIKAGKEQISVNVFMLYLSRMKGALAESGADVTSDTYWGQYVSYDHTTTADHYTNQVLEGLKHIAAAMIIYEELGLKLPKETEDEIDAWIDELIETDGGGSKARLNEILSFNLWRKKKRRFRRSLRNLRRRMPHLPRRRRSAAASFVKECQPLRRNRFQPQISGWSMQMQVLTVRLMRCVPFLKSAWFRAWRRLFASR